MGIEEFLLERAKNEGEARMKEKKEYSFVQSLIKDTDFNNERIASLASVSVSFVKKVRADLDVPKTTG